MASLGPGLPGRLATGLGPGKWGVGRGVPHLGDLIPCPRAVCTPYACFRVDFVAWMQQREIQDRRSPGFHFIASGLRLLAAAEFVIALAAIENVVIISADQYIGEFSAG